MQIETVISHPADPELQMRRDSIGGLAAGAQKGRAEPGRIVYFDLTAHGSFRDFMSTDFLLYVPPEIATISSQIVLR